MSRADVDAVLERLHGHPVVGRDAGFFWSTALEGASLVVTCRPENLFLLGRLMPVVERIADLDLRSPESIRLTATLNGVVDWDIADLLDEEDDAS